MFRSELFQTSTLKRHPSGEVITRVLAAAFNAVDPGTAVKKYLKENPPPKNKRTFAFGLGKAACPMTNAFQPGRRPRRVGIRLATLPG
jgi:glycerate-2-kinase